MANQMTDDRRKRIQRLKKIIILFMLILLLIPIILCMILFNRMQKQQQQMDALREQTSPMMRYGKKRRIERLFLDKKPPLYPQWERAERVKRIFPMKSAGRFI